MPLSTIHTGRVLKSGSPATLSSPAMEMLAGVMAAGLVATVMIGVVLAFRFGGGRAAELCLAPGLLLPVGLALLAALK